MLETGHGDVLRHRQPKGVVNRATVPLHRGASFLLGNPLFSGRFRALRGVKIFFLKGLDRTKFLVYPTIMNMTMWQLLMQIFLASEFAYMHPQISQVEPFQWRT